MRLPDGEPTAMEFSHDGAMLAVANSDGRTQLFDVETGQELGPALAASSPSINDVTFSPDDDSSPPAASIAPARSGASTAAAPSPRPWRTTTRR